MIMFTAAYLSRRDIQVRKFTEGALPILIILGIFFALIMKQPDLGTGVAMAGSVMLLIFVAGVPMQQLFLVGASAVPLLLYLIYSEPYSLQRLMSFRSLG